MVATVKVERTQKSREMKPAQAAALATAKKQYSHLSDTIKNNIVIDGENLMQFLTRLHTEKASGYVLKEYLEDGVLQFILESPEVRPLFDYPEEKVSPELAKKLHIAFFHQNSRNRSVFPLIQWLKRYPRALNQRELCGLLKPVLALRPHCKNSRQLVLGVADHVADYELREAFPEIIAVVEELFDRCLVADLSEKAIELEANKAYFCNNAKKIRATIGDVNAKELENALMMDKSLWVQEQTQIKTASKTALICKKLLKEQLTRIDEGIVHATILACLKDHGDKPVSKVFVHDSVSEANTNAEDLVGAEAAAKARCRDDHQWQGEAFSIKSRNAEEEGEIFLGQYLKAVGLESGELQKFDFECTIKRNDTVKMFGKLVLTKEVVEFYTASRNKLDQYLKKYQVDSHASIASLPGYVVEKIEREEPCLKLELSHLQWYQTKKADDYLNDVLKLEMPSPSKERDPDDVVAALEKVQASKSFKFFSPTAQSNFQQVYKVWSTMKMRVTPDKEVCWGAGLMAFVRASIPYSIVFHEPGDIKFYGREAVQKFIEFYDGNWDHDKVKCLEVYWHLMSKQMREKLTSIRKSLVSTADENLQKERKRIRAAVAASSNCKAELEVAEPKKKKRMAKTDKVVKTEAVEKSPAKPVAKKKGLKMSTEDMFAM